MPWLIVEKGPERGRNVEIPKGKPFVYGRDATCDFATSDASTSRRHFQIVEKDGKWHVEDLGSTHGTTLNGWRITDSKLEDGDAIGAGESVMSFATEGAGRGLVGKVIAGYQILDRIGRGGMGTVYKAKQIALDRIVALKVLSAKFSGNKTFINRFFKEAQAAARLNHPNVVQVYDVREEQGLFLLSIEIMDRGTIQDLANEQQKLPIARVLEIARDAAQGLVYAEKKGIVHGDIKPDNLMINSDGHIKISDLGLARDVGAAADKNEEGIFGTPHFVSPEQAQGKPVDSRSDIYSLGATLYRLIAGQTPHSGQTVGEIIRKQINDEPEEIRKLRPDCPEDLADLVSVMMAKDPAERFTSAQELLEAINALDSSGRLKTASSGTKRLFVVAAATLIVVGVPAFFFVQQKLKQRKDSPPIPAPVVDSRPTTSPVVREGPTDAEMRLRNDKNELEVQTKLLQTQREFDQLKIAGKSEDVASLNAMLEKFRGLSTLHPEAPSTQKVIDEVHALETAIQNAEKKLAENRQKEIDLQKKADETFDGLQKMIIAATNENRFGDALAAALDGKSALANGPRAKEAAALVDKVKADAKAKADEIRTAVNTKLEKNDFAGARAAVKPMSEAFNSSARTGQEFAEIVQLATEGKTLETRINDSERGKLAADRHADQDLLSQTLAKHFRALRDGADVQALALALDQCEKSLVTDGAKKSIAGAKERFARAQRFVRQVTAKFPAITEEIRVTTPGKTVPTGKVTAVDAKGLTVERRPGQPQVIPWTEADPRTLCRTFAKKVAQAPQERADLVFFMIEAGLFDDAAKELDDLKKLAAPEIANDLAVAARELDRETRAAADLAQLRQAYVDAKESGKNWAEVKRAAASFIAIHRGTEAFILASDGSTALVVD